MYLKFNNDNHITYRIYLFPPFRAVAQRERERERPNGFTLIALFMNQFRQGDLRGVGNGKFSGFSYE